MSPVFSFSGQVAVSSRVKEWIKGTLSKVKEGLFPELSSRNESSDSIASLSSKSSIPVLPNNIASDVVNKKIPSRISNNSKNNFKISSEALREQSIFIKSNLPSLDVKPETLSRGYTNS